MTLHFLKVFITTIILFFVGDALWLYGIMNPFFLPKISHLMSTSADGSFVINYYAGLIAYLILGYGLTYFVIVPQYNASPSTLFLEGALFGFCLYALYEFTNYATLTQWPLSFALIDIAWGTVWSGIVACGTSIVLKMLHQS